MKQAVRRTGGEAVRRTLLVLLSLTALPAYRLTAQCPDGSPPPCAAARSTAVRIDPDAIAILPFRVAGPAESQYLREGMVDLLNVGLDGFARWRVLQPRAFLRTVAGDGAALNPAAAARIAREAGAGSFVMGTITAAGPVLVAQAGLYESGQGRVLASVRARGVSSSPAALADSIAAGLARYRATREPGVARRPTSDYTTSSPQALLAFLVSEQLARSGRWAEAVDSLTSAIDRDSTFALAYYGLSRAIAWGQQASSLRVGWDSSALTIERIWAAAARHRERTPTRQRRLLEAAALTNRLESLRAMEDLARSYPDDADVALDRGDTWFHVALQSGLPPSSALERLERAIALEPGMPETYLHVVELQSMLGDTTAAWQSMRRLREIAPGWIAADALELGLRALRGEDPATLPAAGADVLTSAGRYVLWSGDGTPARAIAAADGFAVRRAGSLQEPADRAPALLKRHSFAIAQGRYADAWDRLREAAAIDPDGADVLGAAIVHHLITASHADEARDAARRLYARPGIRPFWAAVLLGWYVATEAPPDSARAVLPGLLAGSDWAAFRDAQLAGLLGILDLRAGDTAAARRALIRGNSEWIETRGVEQLVPTAYFGIVEARLALAAGDLETALTRLSETIGSIGPHYRAEAEELRAQIAERRGDRVAAARAWRNFIELWKDADAPLQPRVTAARAALARLEGMR